MTATSLHLKPARSDDLGAEGAPPPARHIRPVKHRLAMREITANGELMRVLVARDLKVKYKQSVLGPIWLIFQPIALLAAFVIGFHSVAHVETAGVPYALFALSGLSVWSYFSSASAAGAMSLVGNTNLVRYTPCPRLVLTVGNLLASLPALFVPALATVVVAGADGYLSAKLAVAPFLMAWIVLLTAGFAAILASLAVRYHDIPAALPFLLQVGVFLAPIAYPAESVSGITRVLLTLNPLTGLIDAWRWCVLGVPADGLALAVSLILTGTLVIVAWIVFGRLEVTMSDDI